MIIKKVSDKNIDMLPHYVAVYDRDKYHNAMTCHRHIPVYKHVNRATVGPLAKRHLYGVSLMGR